MKILVICQYYYPEPFRIKDICEELVKRGNEVTVVTGTPNYPEGVIYSGYEGRTHTDESINGVKVHRCKIIPRKTGIFYRFLNYYSYPIQANRYVKNLKASDGKPFDVVFVNQLSPVMMATPAISYKKRYDVPIVMYCLDLWPESLVAGGIGRKSIIYKVFHKISEKIYTQMDRILITSRLFRGYFEKEFEIDDSAIEYLPQYAENLFETLPYKTHVGETDLVFAGNIGEIQSVETIIKAARELLDKPVYFHIVGGGTDLERLKELAEGLDNITFYGRCPLEQMPEFYSKADAMLVTLKADPTLSLTLPGKVQSYMAAGKPIIGAIDGETAEVIRAAQCGYCGNAENIEELVNNIKLFIASDDKRQKGENARAFYETYFSRNNFMDKLETTMKSEWERTRSE